MKILHVPQTAIPNRGKRSLIRRLGDESEPLDEAPASSDMLARKTQNNDKDTGNRDEQSSRKDGSRRDGSSRGAAAAAPERQREPAGADEARQDAEQR